LKGDDSLRIIIKFILKNIKEKKLRTLLITISVAASCALFFASNGISESYKSSYITMIRSSIGNSDIIISPDQKSPSKFLKPDAAEGFQDRTDYVIGMMNGAGSYAVNKDESINVVLRGIAYEDLEKINPVILKEEFSIKPFEGNKLIISEKMADKYFLKAGEKIKLKIGENNQVFTIAGVAKGTSYFKTEQNDMVAVAPKSTLEEFNSAKGKATAIYVKAKDLNDKQPLIKELKEVYKNYDVEEAINEKELDQDLQMVRTSFTMMLAIVLIMSMFIIYTAFKVIIMERMPVIGTFRSIGATKKMTNIVLVTESVIYGLIGSIIGDFLGIGILYVVGVLMNPYKKYITPTLEFKTSALFTAFLFGVLVSFISAIVPIVRVSKVPVKDIVLNKIESAKKKKYWKLMLAIILLVYSLMGPMNSPKNQTIAMIINLSALLSIMVSVVLIIPYINTVFVKIFTSIYSMIFGNEGILAAKNLRDNKSLLNNISLLSIGISALFMINVVSFSMNKEVSKAYAAWNCDVAVFPRVDMTTENTEDVRKISTVDGVTDVGPIRTKYNVEVNIDNVPNNKIMVIDSIDSRKFKDFINVDFPDNVKDIPEDFDGDRNIMITSILKSRFNVKIGDTLILKTENGDRSYTVAAIFSTLMENGNYAFIPEKYMKSDFKVKNYDKIFVKTSKDSDTVKNALSDKFKGKRYVINTLQHMEEDNAKSNESMMKQLTAFPFVSIIIGGFGVINNFIISFIERRRAFAVLASIGMSKRQSIKILFIEALSVGLIGGIMGVAAGFVTTVIVPYVMKAMELPLNMHYSYSLFGMCFILGIGITMAASIAPALKSSKLNIIEAVKYE